MSSDSPQSSRSASPNAEAIDSKKRKALPELEVDLEQPEPPSKKAKRALKKGKPLPSSKAGANTEDEAETPDGKKKKEARSQHGVWIGNLPWTMTRPELFQWIVDNSGGAITAENITRVNLPPSKLPPRVVPGEDPSAKKKPQNKGFAYVDFDTFEANVAAIALSETEIEGRKLLIKDSKSYEGRPQKAAPEVVAEEKEKKEESTSRKIFVGNMAFNVTEDDLWAHFEKCGEIDWVKVATFEDSGKCKGYGWVKFREPSAVESAVQGFVRIAEEASDDEEEEDAEDDQNEEAQKQEKSTDAEHGQVDAVDGLSESEQQVKEEKSKSASKQEKKPKPKMRKWWVNRLKGRDLKIQVAEDDKVRYQKRYGKKGTKNVENGARRDGAAPSPRAAGDSDAVKPPRREKPTKFSEDINVARLTGAPVAPQGKKTTFE